jgi:opine dehydrogenase
MAAENLDSVSAVTIIGAGPCGCAFAADLASRGKSVMLYAHPDHRGATDMIEKSNGWLTAAGEISGRFQIKTTSDLYLAIRHSPFIVTTVPSYGQDTIVTLLSQFDLRNHTLIINVGNFFYLSARSRINAHAILETDISPYATRIQGDTVFVKGCKKSLSIWAEPPSASQVDRLEPQAELALRQQIELIFSQKLVWCQNLLEVGLNNVNPVVHCPAALMNAGWIEATKGDFYFYAQGMSPAVSRVTEKVDKERLAIAHAYGLEITPITTYMNQNYNNDREYSDYHDFASGSVVHNKTKSSPSSLNHRYLLEDILYGMVPWYELGVKAGLPSPTIRALIEVAAVVSGFDYFEHGRTLKSAGLGDATMEQVLNALGGPVDKASGAQAPLADSPIGNKVELHTPLQTAQIGA